ncbi:MAG: hypothetical protein MUF64_03170 [Polyangiaceae bacterium]|nr:hypothetical protein [Polyangiaceae bacterium]
MRQLLVEELKNPKPSGEPVIFLEGDGVRSGYHLFVVWNEWANLHQRQRSELILDAFDQVQGREESLKVTLAMGLTRSEALQAGLSVD